MLAKRIIPCLDIKDGTTVKGVNFVNLVEAGDPVELAAAYAKEGADELVFLDITATVEGRKTLKDLVKRVAKSINIPFTVGGGVSTVKDASILLESGADKVAVNSAAVRTPNLIEEISKEFGSQCLVCAIDANFIEGEWKVFLSGGREETKLEAVSWAKEATSRGAGEILLTSMKADGTKKGFSIDLCKKVRESTSVPLIASGGAGSKKDFLNLFSKNAADAGLAASVFHFSEIKIPELKAFLINNNIRVRT